MTILHGTVGKGLVLLMLIGWTTTTHAATMTFTGADLFNDSNVMFPTTAPTVIGSSLRFGPGTTIFEKLLVLPLLPAGGLSGLTSDTISIFINLTRLTGDHDPHLLLGDTSNLVGAVIADNIGGQFLGTTLTDSGNVGTRVVLSSVFTGAGYPLLNASFNINVEWTLQPALTSVVTSFGSGSGNYSEISRALNPTSAIDFVFMSNNDIGEQYQINSLTVTIPDPVPEPSTMLLLGFGLAGLGIFRKTRKMVC